MEQLRQLHQEIGKVLEFYFALPEDERDAWRRSLRTQAYFDALDQRLQPIFAHQDLLHHHRTALRQEWQRVYELLSE